MSTAARRLPRSAPVRPRQVQGRAVIHGGADDGQAQGDVDGVPEAQVLEHRQALVVIHGRDTQSVSARCGRDEGRVRRAMGRTRSSPSVAQGPEDWDS